METILTFHAMEAIAFKGDIEDINAVRNGESYGWTLDLLCSILG